MSDGELSYMLSEMDIPVYRTMDFNKKNLYWLQKNLSVKNSEHKFCTQAMREVNNRIENKIYNS